MSEASALARISYQAFITVSDTSGLEPVIANRVLRCMEQYIYACVYPSAKAEDFSAWAEETMITLLNAEDTGPHCPSTLSRWFAQEVFCWLSGSFDNDAFEAA